MPKEEMKTCPVCHSQIPISAAIHPEGRDYAFYFCGEECLQKWKDAQDQADRNR